MSSIQLKRDPALLAFAAFLLLGAGLLVWQKVVTWQEAVTFLGGALALPGLFGATKDGASAIVLGLTFTLAVGCSDPATPAQKKVIAEGTYTGQLAQCVADHPTRAEADRCADGVRAAWSTKDGGAK